MMHWEARVVDDRSVWNRWIVHEGLEVWRGDIVRVVDTAPGWLWCRSLSGSFGWVSADAVELIEEIPR